MGDERRGPGAGDETARERRRAWRRGAVGALVAMIAGGLFVGSWVAVRYEARLGQMARVLSRERARLAREIDALRGRAAAGDEIADLLRDPGTRVITLKGAGPGLAAHGRLVWSPQAGGRLFVAGLRPAPEGKAYQAWTVRGGAPTPAGAFQVDASGRGVHRLEATGGPVDGFAVTIEPAAGVAAPTGPLVLAPAR